MQCPKCKSKTTVLDTRNNEWRRRECKSAACGHRFYTAEVEIESPRGQKPVGRPRLNADTPARKPKAQPKPAVYAKAAPRKPLPNPAFLARASVVSTPTESRPDNKTSSLPFSFALKMPPGTAARLGK